MDTKATSKEVSREQTRESLIAISQSLPDQVLNSKDVLPDELPGVSLIAVSQTLTDQVLKSKNVPHERTGESVIAISESKLDQAVNNYNVPAQLPPGESLITVSQPLPSNLFGKLKNVVEVEDGGSAESYRSKLISISYTDSPDTKTLPAATVGKFEV